MLLPLLLNNVLADSIVVAPQYSGEVILQPRKVYIKRGKQFLIFNTVDEADAYLAAESAIQTAKQSSRGAAKRKIKALNVVKPVILPEPKLQELEALVARFNIIFDFDATALNDDIEALFELQFRLKELQDDENDIELLLMVT